MSCGGNVVFLWNPLNYHYYTIFYRTLENNIYLFCDIVCCDSEILLLYVLDLYRVYHVGGSRRCFCNHKAMLGLTSIALQPCIAKTSVMIL